MHSWISSCKLVAICCIALLCISPGLARAKKATSSSRPAKSVKSATVKRASGQHKPAKASSSNNSGSEKTAKKTTKSTKVAKNRTKKRIVAARPRGQQTIEGSRAREIQEALIRANYLSGDPSGVWDGETRDAMARFQVDNGWQSKVVPDSRALIKLGLGPKHNQILNGESLLSGKITAETAGQLVPGGSSSER